MFGWFLQRKCEELGLSVTFVKTKFRDWSFLGSVSSFKPLSVTFVKTKSKDKELSTSSGSFKPMKKTRRGTTIATPDSEASIGNSCSTTPA